jgi:hypothetical protein
MDVSALKKQFASALYLEPGNPFKAALSVFPEDTGSACLYAVQWKDDPEVWDEIERLSKSPDINSIPDKTQVAKAAWDLATTCFEGKDRIAALRLLSEILGFMPDKTINKNITEKSEFNKVMLVKDHGDNADWEKQLLAQQARLTNAE